MTQTQKSQTTQEKKEQAYQKHVEQATPRYSLPWRMCKAFVTGGVLCLIGQMILNYAANRAGLDQETAGSWCSMLLVLASVILTGLNLYPKLVEWGGAGALVPITGFANSIASAAIEYQKEGQVFGIGCKIFTIAGPVILYGILTSWGLGVLYWLLGLAGIVS
ncbi:MAG: SpoVA/SpoVAEb family sporulation membrane protein [Clostridiales bacterium]|nr:SpoVA/SpoVAEb family sporulation membrane protein [Clostridiales bacterium]